MHIWKFRVFFSGLYSVFPYTRIDLDIQKSRQSNQCLQSQRKCQSQPKYFKIYSDYLLSGNARNKNSFQGAYDDESESSSVNRRNYIELAQCIAEFWHFSHLQTVSVHGSSTGTGSLFRAMSHTIQNDLFDCILDYYGSY